MLEARLNLPEIVVIREVQIREVVRIDIQALAVIEDAFVALATGKAIVPQPMHIEVAEHHGELDVKAAYVAGFSEFAIKVAAGFYDNSKKGLPTASGIMILVSSETGFPRAVLLDNGYLTQVRTAMAGALAAKYLAPQQISAVGVIGAGLQGRFQVRALRLVRHFGRVIVFDMVEELAERYALEMQSELNIEVAVARSVSEVVQSCNLVVTSTPSRSPFVLLEDVHACLHITAMGADGPGKQELDSRIFGRADRVVCDRKLQCFRIGELQHALSEGVVTENSDIVELGQIVAGQTFGRRRDTDLTVCDLTGVGVQDTAIAALAYRLIHERQTKEERIVAG
jgi:ectoine utilization protein EutC